MLPSSNFTRKVSHGESPAQLPSHPALLGQRGHPFVPFVPCGEPDAAPSTTASAPNAHVSNLGHTRLARSQLCRSYTKGTVNEFKLLLTWVFKLFQGTFQATSNFFERLFGEIAIFPRDFWRHRIYCTTANVFHHRQAAFPLHGLMRFSTGLFSRGQLLNRRPLGRAANSRRLSRRTGKAANRRPR